jgi:hypothetical protein
MYKCVIAMTDQELKDFLAQLSAENAAGFAAVREAQAADARAIAASRIRADAEMDEVKRVMKELGKRMGSMAQNQGAVAEEFFYNSLREMPVLGGIEYDQVLAHVMAGNKKSQAEFDIVMINGKSIAVIEVKYKCHPADVDKAEHLMQRYRELMPAYKDYTLYGGVAGFSVPDDVVQAAKDKGLFVLKRSGDVIEFDTAGMRGFVCTTAV